MNRAPWAPMAAPPLPLRDDAEWDTCSHAYLAEECPTPWEHWGTPHFITGATELADEGLLRLKLSYAMPVIPSPGMVRLSAGT